jgi:GNAT superfamily N-acetyltransferase
MSSDLRIEPLLDLAGGLDGLRRQAAGEGFRFLDRLEAEWRSGANRFAEPGEICLAACRADDLVAVGGLNRDPYAGQDGIGRLRHLYVRQSARRSGVGAALVRQLLGHAEGVFHAVRLRTETREAAAFYVSLGFRCVQEHAASHVMILRPRPHEASKL